MVSEPLPVVPRRRFPWWVTSHALVPAVSFVAALAAVRGLLALSTASTRAAWMDWASTSVVNLLDHPVGALVASAFVGSGYLAVWCVLGLVGLVTTGWRFGILRTTVIAVAAHVIGTYLSEGLLALRVLAHALPVDQLTTQDLGPSYVVAAALMVGVGFGPAPGRLLCTLGYAALAPELFEGLGALDMTAVGHACAIVTGMAVAYLLSRFAPWRPARSADGT